jgi:hypothetical protein
MTQRSRSESNDGWLSSLIDAARLVESKSVTEERLTMRSHLRIGSNRDQTIRAIGKATYASSVEPAMARRQVLKLLREQKLGGSMPGSARLGGKIRIGRNSTK